jgi:cyclase
MVELRRRADALRHNMTPSERRLWRRLKRSGLRFKPQHILYPYIIDFHSPRHSVCVEVDGAIHATQRDYDARRDLYLTQKYRVRIVRVSNDEVDQMLDTVVERIVAACR